MKKLVYLFMNLISIFLFIFIFSQKIIINAYDDIKLNADEKIICEVDIEDDFDVKTIVVVLKSDFSQYSGISNEVMNKLLCVENISNIEDLSEVPSEYLLDSKTLIDSNTDTVLHLKSIQFKQILKIHLNAKTKVEVIETIRKIEVFNEVLYVGPNYFCEQESIITNDTFINEQWSFNNIEGTHIFDAWDFSQGLNEIRVGIIDSGISMHADLSGNIVNGFDYYNNNGNENDDEAGHGTNVAGIIGATGNNNEGIVGICQNVSLVPMQTVYDSSDTGYHDVNSVIEAIEDARNMWNTENRISVINYSVSGFGSRPDILAAIEQYQGLFVWSAGNQRDNLDELPNIESYNLENLISVGAIDINNNLSVWSEDSGSNFGSAVNIYAPGTDILTTNLMAECEWDVVFPDGYRLCELHDQYIDEYFNYINEGVRDNNGNILISPNMTELIIPFFNALMSTRENIFSSHHLSNGYHTVSGTSFAAPHVTGVSALLLSINENLSASQLKQAILESADVITITVPDTSEGADENDTVTQNVLKLNAYNAIKEVLKNYSSHTNYSLNSNANINFNKTINSNDQYFDELNGFYELNVSTSQYYNFDISSNNLIDVKLFDAEMNEISYSDLELSTSKVYFKQLLFIGKYYLWVKYSDRETNGTINTKINTVQTSNLIVGNNNILLDDIYVIEDFTFTNNNSAGFYKITLNATNSSGTIEYPEECIKVYADEAQQQMLARLETIFYTLDAETQGDSNNLIVFLEYGQPYYINIDLPNDSYSSMYINIERLSNTYDIIESNTSEEHVILNENTTAYGDFIQRIEVHQAGTYNISFVHNGPQSEENLMGQEDPLYLYYAFYKEVYSPAEQFGDLEMIFPHIASSMGGTISFTFNLQPGVYYIGYYNKLNNEPMSISITS